VAMAVPVVTLLIFSGPENMGICMSFRGYRQVQTKQKRYFIKTLSDNAGAYFSILDL